MSEREQYEQALRRLEYDLDEAREVARKLWSDPAPLVMHTAGTLRQYPWLTTDQPASAAGEEGGG